MGLHTVCGMVYVMGLNTVCVKGLNMACVMGLNSYGAGKVEMSSKN